MNWEEIYQKTITIRVFEKHVEREFSQGNMRGTTHCCIGQEIIPVFVMENINREKDYVVGTHRCHGQVIAYTNDCYRLACEMMGKKDGFVDGMGGSQHIRFENYITNGITGGMVAVGTGIAMGIKKSSSEGIVISFLGDGGFNEGYVQEAMNLSSVYGLPILFVCENNKYAMSTNTDRHSAGTFGNRIRALDINYISSETKKPEKLRNDIERAFSVVRDNRTPCFIDVHTARLCGHSKSDTNSYKTENEIKEEIDNDYLKMIEKKIGADNVLNIRKLVEKNIDEIFIKARNCCEP